MKREHFLKVIEEALDSLPQEFGSRIRNVAVLVEDMPPNQPLPQSEQQRRLLLGLFHGVPTTKKRIFDLPTGPDYIVLYQKNIEAACSSEAEVREQILLTIIHELGHYFGMDENQLKDVQLTSLESESSGVWQHRDSLPNRSLRSPASLPNTLQTSAEGTPPGQSRYLYNRGLPWTDSSLPSFSMARDSS
jgi:predicted Zn-dependent protease with MMP-like domain